MRRLYFTADIDRDVNVQIPGETAAGSLDRGSGTAPRFSSSERGLGSLLEVLDSVGIRGTLFYEGRTAEEIDCSMASGHCTGIHGYDHEDLTSLSDIGLADVLDRAHAAISDNVGRPSCSRAPYMTADDRVLQAFSELGIRTDSSFYTDVGGTTGPYRIGDVTEFPVPKARDAEGKVIAAYLWPMHEGRRGPDDYIDMARGIDGPLVLCDHSWHLVETRDGGPMSREDIARTREDMVRVLEGILDLGFVPSTLV